MTFTMRAMKTHPSAQPLGSFDVELRYIGRRRTAAAIGLINQPGRLRIPIPNRDCHEPPPVCVPRTGRPEKRGSKPETTENQSTTKDQPSGKHNRNEAP